jgi:hypothetical protein
MLTTRLLPEPRFRMRGAIPSYAFSVLTRKTLLLLRPNYIKWRMKFPYFSYSLLPKAPSFCASCSQRNFWEAGFLLTLEKSSRIRNKLTWLYMASGNPVFVGMT